MKFRPLHDRVVVGRLEAVKSPRAASSFPTRPKKTPTEDEAVAVGPGAPDDTGNLVPLDVKAGGRILFGKWSGTEVKPDGEELVMSDIMGIVEDGVGKRKAA